MKKFLVLLMFCCSCLFASPGKILGNIVNVVESGASTVQVEKTLKKYVNVKSIAAEVAGRSAWRGAQKSEQEKFIDKFSQELLDYYASTIRNLSRYKYSLIARPSAARQVLRVVNPNGSTTDFVIFFQKSSGSWLIIDSSFNGVSLVGQWRAKLSHKIRQYGLSGAFDG